MPVLLPPDAKHQPKRVASAGVRRAIEAAGAAVHMETTEEPIPLSKQRPAQQEANHDSEMMAMLRDIL